MKSSLRIGIVTTWFERGAAYVSRQYRDALETFAEVFIYARGGEQYATTDPNWNSPYVTWSPIPLNRKATALPRKHFLRWLSKNKIDVVLFNEQQWWPPVQWVSELGLRCGAYVDYYTERTVPFFAAYDFLLCNTLRHFNVFQWHPNAFYIPWGTDIDLFRPQPNKRGNDKNVVFFHSAGMNPRRKGTDLLLRAAEKQRLPSQLIIHSQVSLAENICGLDALIEKLVEANRLTVIEETVSAPGLYHMGDIYVYPSRLDGIGLSVPEALACGLPVITSDYAPMNEFVNSTNGWLVPVKKVYSRADGYYWPQSEINVEQLASTMDHVSMQPHLVAELKSQARRYAEDNLDWRKNASRLADVFTGSALKENPGKQIAGCLTELEDTLIDWRAGLSNRRPVIYRFLSMAGRVRNALGRR